MKEPRKNELRNSNARLTQRIKELEARLPVSSLAFEFERISHELQVRQAELETHNRELKEAQQHLENSRNRYADLYDFAPVGYLTFDGKGVIREINLTAAGMLGIDRSRLIGVPFHPSVAREDLAQFRKHLCERTNPAERVATEMRVIHKDQEPIPVLMQSTLLRDGEKGGFLCRAAISDITPLRKAEQAAMETAALNRGILGALTAHIALIDQKGYVVTVNEAWKHFARENGDATFSHTGTGQNYLTVCRNSAGLAEAKAARKGIEAVLRGKQASFQMEYPCHSPSEERWFLMSVTPLSSSRRGAVISHVNITDRKQAEEALRSERDLVAAMFETSGALLIVLDEAGRVLRFNRACEQVTGYSAAEIAGQPIWNLLLAKDEGNAVRTVFKELRTSKLPSRYENHWRTKDGRCRLISWANTVLTGEGGKVKAIIAAGRDITEQRRLEAEVLAISDREQQRIGQDLHDSLGQQLTAVRLMCHSFQEDPALKDPTLMHKANRIAGLLEEAIRQTRALSQGLAPLQPGAGGLMDALRELARITSETGKVKCRLQCAKPVSIADSAVAVHLYRIAQEAVNNANKHGHAGEISIELKSSKSTLGLRISDNGKGFDGAGKQRRGMGLEVMNHRAEIMGGKLTFQSRKGKGVTVKCTVPVRKAFASTKA